MSRHDLTDPQWTVIEPLIPGQRSGPGRKRNDDRRTRNGIRFVLKTGCTWEDVPRTYGSPATCWRRFRAWAAEGTWEPSWRTVLSQLEAQGKREWAQAFLDGRVVPAKKGGPASVRPQSARARR